MFWQMLQMFEGQIDKQTPRSVSSAFFGTYIGPQNIKTHKQHLKMYKSIDDKILKPSSICEHVTLDFAFLSFCKINGISFQFWSYIITIIYL